MPHGVSGRSVASVLAPCTTLRELSANLSCASLRRFCRSVPPLAARLAERESLSCGFAMGHLGGLSTQAHTAMQHNMAQHRIFDLHQTIVLKCGGKTSPRSCHALPSEPHRQDRYAREGKQKLYRKGRG